MASPTQAAPLHPLQLPPDADPNADRRFPYAGGGGRDVHPDDPERKYLVPYCYHGWPAQHRRPTYGNVNTELWGCEGYIWGGLDPGDGYYCGYKETANVHSRYGVTEPQILNKAWNGLSWWQPKPDKAFFKERRESVNRAAFLAKTPPSSPAKSRSPAKPGSPLKRLASASPSDAPLAGPSSSKRSKTG